MIVLGLGFLAGTAAAQDAAALSGRKEKLSYALGMEVANNIRKQSVEVDTASLIRGFRDQLSQGKTLLAEEEVRAILGELRQELKRKQVALQAEKVLAANELAEKNKKNGEAFLAKNRAEPGVVTLESGLQYKILKAGAGKTPTPEDTVLCHYRGALLDGSEFENSYQRGKPATLPLKKLMRGWSEALQRMPVGSKWQLFIPPDLAYGERGVDRSSIGPNAALIFEVELHSIVPPPVAKAKTPAAAPR
jgi:FKBP-type peptidyl-prolyl cis-trans isomerase